MRPKIISPLLILLAPILLMGLTACGVSQASDTAPSGPRGNPENGRRLEQMGAISALVTPTPYIQPAPTVRIVGTPTPLPPIEPTPIDLESTIAQAVEAALAAQAAATPTATEAPEPASTPIPSTPTPAPTATPLPPTPTPFRATPTPRPRIVWQEADRWTGNKILITNNFRVRADEWRITWTAQPGPVEFVFKIKLYNSNQMLKTVVIDETNPEPNSLVFGRPDDYDYTDYYLVIVAHQPYTVIVEELIR